MPDCKYCGKEIDFKQDKVKDKWVAVNSDDGSTHFCKQYKSKEEEPHLSRFGSGRQKSFYEEMEEMEEAFRSKPRLPMKPRKPPEPPKPKDKKTYWTIIHVYHEWSCEMVNNPSSYCTCKTHIEEGEKGWSASEEDKKRVYHIHRDPEGYEINTKLNENLLPSYRARYKPRRLRLGHRLIRIEG